MRRIAILATAALAVALFAVAPAARTAHRWSPSAVDFELAQPALHAAGRGRVTSPPIRPGRRFNLVGLRWSAGRAPAVSLRARLHDGGWTHWVRVASDGDHGPDPGTGERRAVGASDPLWVGRADTVQYRLSHPVGGLRLHFVAADGSAPGADRSAGSVHRATASRPTIMRRSSWGASHCRPRVRPAQGQVKVAFIHHTDTATAYSPEDVPSMILAICRYHRNSNGWNDIGYNFLVDRFGRIWEGRAGGLSKPIVGAHVRGFNSQSTGIANLGTFISTPQTDAAIGAMARLIRWKLPLHGQPTSGRVTLVSGGGAGNRYRAGRAVELRRISGHRDANYTDCPGDALYAQLPELRRRVGAVGPAPAGPAPTVTLQQPASRVQAGRLLEVSGAIDPPKPYVTVALDKSGRHRRWRLYRRIPIPVSDGAFDKKLRLREPGLYRVFISFGGDGANAPARSVAYRVRVPHQAG